MNPEFVVANNEENISEFKKKNKNENSKKYYKNNIANDKIETFCEYCQIIHNPLRLTYEKNIAKNGEYVCERKGGFLSGSTSKPKKENPYAIEGKKECNNCKCVKDFEEFGLDKLKSDGYATQCKICRSDKSRSNYIKIKSNQEE